LLEYENHVFQKEIYLKTHNVAWNRNTSAVFGKKLSTEMAELLRLMCMTNVGIRQSMTQTVDERPEGWFWRFFITKHSMIISGCYCNPDSSCKYGCINTMSFIVSVMVVYYKKLHPVQTAFKVSCSKKTLITKKWNRTCI